MVPMQTFLDGNNYLGSIAPNLLDHPGLDAFRKAFDRISRRTDVASVWAQIELDWDQYPGDEWPYATRIFVITTASPETVDGWVTELQADPCGELEAAEIACIGPIPPDHRAVFVWWD